VQKDFQPNKEVTAYLLIKAFRDDFPLSLFILQKSKNLEFFNLLCQAFE